MGVIISDASPLVHLSAIGRFDLLQSLYTALLIPPAVWSEVTVAGKGRLGAAELSTAINMGWIEVKPPSADALAHQALRGLDLGEREALALALDKAQFVLLDELRGRAAARRIGVIAIGTLGVLVEAKRRGESGVSARRTGTPSPTFSTAAHSRTRTTRVAPGGRGTPGQMTP